MFLAYSYKNFSCKNIYLSEIWWDSDGDSEIDTLAGSETVYDDLVTFNVGLFGVPFGRIELRWFAVDNADNEENTHYQAHLVMEG